ncbi:MAG: hypothetical protein HYZ72_16480 [Deltaproteobacteria bacterium]|nr:hypothetical protein [Deltaproteobacteria bacterium]
MQYFCGVDTGGTFTDCVVMDERGQITIAKSPSTPKDFAEGFFNALEVAADKLGLTLIQLMQNTRLLLHGTTIGTNAIVQLKGVKTGLITTLRWLITFSLWQRRDDSVTIALWTPLRLPGS